MKTRHKIHLSVREIQFLTILSLTTVLVAGVPQIAAAYVGPGAALTLIGSLLGLIGAVLMALAIVFFWPIRMLIRRLRGQTEQESATPEEESAYSQNTQEPSMPSPDHYADEYK